MRAEPEVTAPAPLSREVDSERRGTVVAVRPCMLDFASSDGLLSPGTLLGEYIIESKATVRSTAKKFGVSKSTVHKDVSQRLKVLNPALYRQVREILDTNKSERHIRGGLATKKKYLQKKASESEKS